MAITLLSIPTPHQTLFSHRLYANSNSCLHGSAALLRYPSKSFILLSSSSPSSLASVADDNPLPPPPCARPVQSESATVDSGEPPVGGCKACGRQEIEKGCNGEGRIQGGIATFPGFGWWPIKAYRPCPGFVHLVAGIGGKGKAWMKLPLGGGRKNSYRKQH
ncbi:hypothetical protein GH714_006902 [Hevea brasiliensis]|uniref:Uncharacterized protein n=1 Tax=Hevea brasiliensis TaxID=3981 RepID=A0A6A6LEC4_HEVBR|nr:hypothetical protein GH714_006902 [Hevea brasiliensis]